MATFNYSFTVAVPRPAVTAFHHDTRALKRLFPPPIIVELHHFEPLAENAEASFTMWFGPIPLRWRAVHTDVSPEGFTDTQLTGPLARWQHTHRFVAVDDEHTRVEEHINYEHEPGLKGLFTRLLFNRPALTLLFSYRQLVTRWALRRNGVGNRGPAWAVVLLAIPALIFLLQRRMRRKEEDSYE